VKGEARLASFTAMSSPGGRLYGLFCPAVAALSKPNEFLRRFLNCPLPSPKKCQQQHKRPWQQQSLSTISEFSGISLDLHFHPSRRSTLFIHHEEPHLNRNHLPIRLTNHRRPATHQNLHNIRNMPPFHASIRPILIQRRNATTIPI